jgi:Protein of unknown function (DUF402)
MRVIEDRGDFVALYLQPGNILSRMGDAEGNPTRDLAHATTRILRTWDTNHAVHLVRFGDEHSTQLYWDEHTWEFRCWYINFQQPLKRTALGFESMDLTLDLLISPDRTRWEWKDEDEFAYGIEHGWYTPEQLTHLKAYGERPLADARAGRPPFDAGWEHWRPPPEWTPLELLAGWDA